MKKIFILLLAYIVMLSGCAKPEKTDADTMEIVCTSFPYYDFARNIAGDRAEVKLLVPAGVDIHTFDPTPQDMIEASGADMFISNGGESEEWAKDFVNSLDEKPTEVMYMTELVELADGEDEHIWTSPVNAKIISSLICDRLSAIDAVNADYYKENLATYSDKLSELDSQFKDAVENAKRNTVVFADRFPFYYLMKEYAIEYKSAFSGCSELTEPTAKNVSDLIDTVKSENIPIVFYVEFSNRKICDTICNETGASSALMHSAHNLTKAEFDSGADYISLMTQNAKALKEALS